MVNKGNNHKYILAIVAIISIFAIVLMGTNGDLPEVTEGNDLAGMGYETTVSKGQFGACSDSDGGIEKYKYGELTHTSVIGKGGNWAGPLFPGEKDSCTNIEAYIPNVGPTYLVDMLYLFGEQTAAQGRQIRYTSDPSLWDTKVGEYVYLGRPSGKNVYEAFCHKSTLNNGITYIQPNALIKECPNGCENGACRTMTQQNAESRKPLAYPRTKEKR